MFLAADLRAHIHQIPPPSNALAKFLKLSSIFLSDLPGTSIIPIGFKFIFKVTNVT